MAGLALPFGNPATSYTPNRTPPQSGSPAGTIPGAINFSPGATNDYGSQYASAVGTNQQLYNAILGGYQQTMQTQQAAQAKTQAGYGDLYNSVIGGIQGIGASQQQAINDSYAAQQGQADQDLVSRGLGNTTVQSSVNRGLQLDNQKANIALANQIAGLTAGYQSNLGLAGLGYAGQAAQQNTQLAGQQLGFMNSVMAPYPNPQAFGQLAQQRGAAAQSQADQARLNGGIGALPYGAGGAVSNGAGAGYVPGTGHFANVGAGASYFGGASGGGYAAPSATAPWNVPPSSGYLDDGSGFMGNAWDALTGLQNNYNAAYGDIQGGGGDYGTPSEYAPAGYEPDYGYTDASFDPMSYF